MPKLVLNGDCLDLMKTIRDGAVDLILTDPPYGVTARNKWDSIVPVAPMWDEFWRVLKPNGAVVMTAMQPFSSLMVSSQYECFKYEWVWRKPQGTGFLNAKKQPLRNHEVALVFYKKQPTYNPQMLPGKPYTCKSGRASLNYGEQESVVTVNEGYRYPLTVIDFNYDKNKLHPTQKPVSLFEYFVNTYTNPGDLVLDPFAGSGTTGVACLNTGRDFVLIEKDPKFYGVVVERLSNG